MKINIAENIRRFRKERGLTQEQLAEVLDVTVGAVSKWELGSSVPDIELIVDKNSYLDKGIVGIRTACACWLPKEDEAGIKKYLQEAVRVAKQFDEAPDCSMRNVKFNY